MRDDQDTGAALRAQYAMEGGVTATFSGRAADYAASRPDYPRILFETLKNSCGLPGGATVADVGAGTGLLTRGLLQCGFRVIAVEPNAEMRQQADAQLGRINGYRSVGGSAESMPLDSGSMDLITAAQAFHWFDAERARTEFLRALRPGGQVVIICNDRVADEPINAALDELARDFGGSKRSTLVAHDDRSNLPKFFGSAPTRRFKWPHEQILNEEGFLGLVFSRSYMPAKETPQGCKAADRLQEIFRRFAVEGKIKIPYQTVATIGRPD